MTRSLPMPAADGPAPAETKSLHTRNGLLPDTAALSPAYPVTHSLVSLDRHAAPPLTPNRVRPMPPAMRPPADRPETGCHVRRTPRLPEPVFPLQLKSQNIMRPAPEFPASLRP